MTVNDSDMYVRWKDEAWSSYLLWQIMTNGLSESLQAKELDLVTAVEEI